MKKLLLSFALFPLFLPAFSFGSIRNVVESSSGVSMINSTETEAEGSNARTESSISTTVNGEEVTIKTNQPGLVEVKNTGGKVEIKTSKGITPTIIITGVPTQNVEQSSFSETINNRTIVIYSSLKSFFKRIFKSFFQKT